MSNLIKTPQMYIREAGELAQRAMLEEKFFEAVALYRTSIALANEVEDKVYLHLAWCYLQLNLGELALLTVEKIKNKEHFAGSDFLQEIEQSAAVRRDGLKKISHHTYIRLKILADKIRNLYGDRLEQVCLLDLGGGSGYLACFLPEVKYFLAEPSVNAVLADDLDAFAGIFNCVVACHVFEHIGQNDRENFLDKLSTAATEYILLLNPFVKDSQEEAVYREALCLLKEVTSAPWVQEHIEASTPFLAEIEQYAIKNGYKLDIQENNSGFFTVLFVFMEHFAQIAKRYEDFAKINQFFNECNAKFLANKDLPNDYLCTIDIRKCDYWETR